MLSYLSLFLLIFDLAIPPVKFIGSAPFSILISLGVLISGRKNIGNYSEIKSFFLPFYIFYFTLLFYITSRVLFSGEINYLLSTLKSLVIFSASVIYIYTFGCQQINDKLINVFFINGVICLIAGSIPAALDLVYFFKINVIEIEHIPYRNAFLAGSGYFGMASAYSLIILLSAHKLVKDGVSFCFIIKFMVILIAGILAGRTAFIAILISCLYIASKSVKYSILATSIIILIIGIVLSVDMLSVYSKWMFEFVSINNGSISLSSTTSTDVLQRMYFMPTNDLTWVWGDGRYVDGDGYYMNTDAGYMRNLFFGGLPFALLIIAYAFLFAIKSKDNFFLFFMFPLLLALHYKGVFILNNPAGIAILALLAYWFHNEQMTRKNLPDIN
ncbi:hypothetical protein OQ486_13100 [Plesiomonas shigelloides]|uniref:hypothetical protein n=1 Tax=Plesiomonas shigelloides TaxID=703 RepID=UPI00224700D7|nr:hypothetical protein [Plesiomonas shigelloides]MCX2534402.1 hypothetical protein [Plesiomonas shigelloides]